MFVCVGIGSWVGVCVCVSVWRWVRRGGTVLEQMGAVPPPGSGF